MIIIYKNKRLILILSMLTILITVFSMNINAAENFSSHEKSADSNNSLLPPNQLIIFGELGYADNSGLNEISEKVAEDIAYEHTLSGYSGYSAGKNENANINYGGELDYRYFYNSFGFGFGAGFSNTEAETRVDNPDDDITAHARLFAMFITASINYRYIINNNSCLILGGGIGGYSSIIGVGYDGTVQNSVTVDTYTLYSDTLGYHIKADYSYIFDSICLTAGISGKYVEFKNFEDDSNEKRKMDAGLTGIYFYAGAGIVW